MADRKTGEDTKRKADQLAGANSLADALKRSREAKERGNLRKARRIMREFRERDS